MRSRVFRPGAGGAASLGPCAELDVIDVLGDGWLVAADRAGRVAAKPDLGEGCGERVEEQEPADERVADPEGELSASVAWIEPITPGRTPRTPPSAQLGASSGGGGCGNRQR